MTKFTLKVGKEIMQLQHEMDESFQDFQAKIFALTDIPPKNLKILAKSKMIKDNKTLFELPEGIQLVIMGTKTTQQLKVEKGTIMIQQKVTQKEKYPKRHGLVNIGNTCYMNSAIQFLRSIPQLNKFIKTHKITNVNTPEQRIAVSIAQIFNELEYKDFQPKMFVALFLQKNNQFTPFGTQQDSDQFMQKLLTNISEATPQHRQKLAQLFQIQFMQTLKNTQIQQGEQINVTESMKMCCSLGGVQKQIKVGTLLQGIKMSLDTQLQKISLVDNNSHIYHKKIRFNKLPKYLLVQMVRFFWKEAGEDHGSKATATKICKSIDFGTNLDVFDYCTPNLKQELIKGRQAIEENKKIEQESYKKSYEDYKNSLGDTNKPETRIIEEFKEKWERPKRLQQGLETGMFQMVSVVTHLGHSIQQGHYLAWCKETEDQWTKYDDDTVYPQPESKVLQLRGGQPNLQIAYIVLYRKIFAKPL